MTLCMPPSFDWTRNSLPTLNSLLDSLLHPNIAEHHRTSQIASFSFVFPPHFFGGDTQLNSPEECTQQRRHCLTYSEIFVFILYLFFSFRTSVDSLTDFLVCVNVCGRVVCISLLFVVYTKKVHLVITQRKN